MLLYATQIYLRRIGENSRRINEDFVKYTDSNSDNNNLLKFDRINNRMGIKSINPTHDFEVGGDAFISGGVTIHGDLNVDSGVLFVDVSANRIGINDTTPEYNLDVNGNGRFTGPLNANDALNVTGHLAANYTLSVNNDFSVGGTDLFVDVSTNRVGINKNNPGYTLDVNGTGNFSGDVSAANLSATNLTGTLQTGNQSNITTVGTLGSLTVTGPITANGGVTGTHMELSGDLKVGNNDLYVDTTNSYVGIHILNPLYPLHVVGNGFINGNLQIANGNGLTLVAGTPSSTSNTLYNVGGSLYFNGSAVGGGAINLSDITIDQNLDMGTYNITNANELSLNQALSLTSHTPSTTTNKLYNSGGTLYWNGNQISNKEYLSFSAQFVFMTLEDSYNVWWVFQNKRNLLKHLASNYINGTRNYIRHMKTTYTQNGLSIYTGYTNGGYIYGFTSGKIYRIDFHVNYSVNNIGYLSGDPYDSVYLEVSPNTDGSSSSELIEARSYAKDTGSDPETFVYSGTYFYNCNNNNDKIFLYIQNRYRYFCPFDDVQNNFTISVQQV